MPNRTIKSRTQDIEYAARKDTDNALRGRTCKYVQESTDARIWYATVAQRRAAVVALQDAFFLALCRLTRTEPEDRAK